jgi:predicted O-linked N-acetylglucosamine transferase (SPINDLY family)
MASTFFKSALDAWRRGDRARALDQCNAAVQQGEAVEADTEQADVHRLLAEIHGSEGRIDLAIFACQQVARLAPRDAANLRRLAVLLTQSRNPAAAAVVLQKSLEMEPDNMRALNNLGSLFNEAGRAEEAIPVLQRALALRSDYSVAMVNLGNALNAVGRCEEALAHFDRAIALDPSIAPAHVGRGTALAAAGNSAEAIAAYHQALALNPRDPRVLIQMGDTMLKGGFASNALSAFTAALELLPGDIHAQQGRVFAIMALNRHEEAAEAIAALRAAAPMNHYLQGHQLHAQLHCADWSEFEASSRDIALRVRCGERVDLPLSFLVHNESPADQLICARTFMADLTPPRVPALERPAHRSETRLRVAYLSPDFRDHPVGQLIAGVIEAHDRSRFETHAFCTEPDDGSDMRRRLETGFEHFHSVRDCSDLEIAERIAAAGIDVLVDLGGHTRGSRTPLLAHRPAPVQVSFLGFPGTVGADFIDYIVADRHVIPESDQAHYAEKVIYLPDSYLPGALPAVADAPGRVAAGLPAAGFVFCSLNSPHKILPAVFGSWMRILTAVPDSVLWLRDGGDVVRRNLAREAQARGVDPVRLIHAPKVATLADHLARLGRADLFLDTRPYNAHTTACDALAAGVPVLTMRGGSFASRVATSLLFSCGLEYLSVDSHQEYERLAVELARTPGELARLKAHLLGARAGAPLFDTPRFCRNLETALLEISARHARGESPAPLYVG